MAIKYLIDSIDIKEVYGVCVTDSEGIVNRPKLKQPAFVSWDNYHGQVVDMKHKYYEPREITLTCFIKATTKQDFLNNLIAFEQLFDKPRLHRLMIDVVANKPLVYEVYSADEIAIKKKWQETDMVGTFSLKLIEPEPIKKVLKATNSISITITTQKLVNIYWGDGSADEDVSGTNKTITHTYQQDGTYYPIITGCIDEITAFTTNGTIVWNKL